MTPKEFYESLQEKKPFTKLTNTRISDNLTNVFEFAKEYEQKQLLLHNVSQQRELLEVYTKQIKEDNEFTEEITFQDINKCIASNCG